MITPDTRDSSPAAMAAEGAAEKSPYKEDAPYKDGSLISLKGKSLKGSLEGETYLRDGSEFYPKATLDARLKDGPAFSHPWPDSDDMAKLAAAYKELTGRPVGGGYNLLRATFRVHGPDTVPFMAALYAQAPTFVNLLADLRLNPPRLLQSEVPKMPKASPPPLSIVNDFDNAWLDKTAQSEWGDSKKLDTISCPPHLYREHASSHRMTVNGWVCDTCAGVA